MQQALRGKVALVTGGGRGLGEATCHVLGAAEASVVVADIKHDLAKKVAADVMATGAKATALEVDVADERSVADAVRSARAEHGGIDVLVNNAGIDVTVSIDNLKVSEWDRIIGVNLRGPFLMSKYVFEVMKERRSGHIVNVTSTAAKRAWANASAYHASKWGLLGFSHALHVEGREHNIKVTAVVGGGMRTPFLFERFPDLDPGLLQDPKNVAETIRFVLTQPHETVIPEVLVIPMTETSWP